MNTFSAIVGRFHLTFIPKHAAAVDFEFSGRPYLKLADWNNYSAELPDDIHAFEWRTFQQEYRDYIDLAKLAQLVPVIGAPVGAIVNYKLIDKLGKTAINAYRMRLAGAQKLLAT